MHSPVPNLGHPHCPHGALKKGGVLSGPILRASFNNCVQRNQTLGLGLESVSVWGQTKVRVRTGFRARVFKIKRFGFKLK